MLNSKERAYLRKLAQTEDAIFQIGKTGINDNLIAQIAGALEKRELIKITLLDSMVDQSDDKKEVANTLAEMTNSEVVHVLGKKITLYKKSEKNPKLELSETKESKNNKKKDTKSKTHSKPNSKSKFKSTSTSKFKSNSKPKKDFKSKDSSKTKREFKPSK